MKTPYEYFRELMNIPRTSGNEKAAADFVERIALDAGCDVYRDEMNNLIVKKAASEGLENVPAFMLQGHLDMVGEAAAGVNHDFMTDPVKPIIDGDILRADGTTLGGDDGVAVSIMLAALTDETLVHPALECVFTVQEETGLFGAGALDKSRLTARSLLNLDAGPEGLFIVSCAGGCRMSLTRPVTVTAASQIGYKLVVTGLVGGHSGELIDRQSGNAILMSGILSDGILSAGGQIGVPTAGDKDNVIPSNCVTYFAFDGDVDSVLNPIKENLIASYGATDEGLNIYWERCELESVLKSDDAEAMLGILRLLPNGVIRRTVGMTELVETSANVAVIRMVDGNLIIHLSLRSSSDFEKKQLMRRVETVADIFGADCKSSGVYPGWNYEQNSPLRDMACAAFEKVYGYAPKCEGIHAGLECGLFKGTLPDLDIVSTGPLYGDLHMPTEWLNIPSLQRTYEFAKQLITDFANSKK